MHMVMVVFRELQAVAWYLLCMLCVAIMLILYIIKIQLIVQYISFHMHISDFGGC